jgi:hypothetical protein
MFGKYLDPLNLTVEVSCGSRLFPGEGEKNSQVGLCDASSYNVSFIVIGLDV